MSYITNKKETADNHPTIYIFFFEHEEMKRLISVPTCRVDKWIVSYKIRNANDKKYNDNSQNE